MNDYSAVKEEQQEYHPENNNGSLASRLLRAEGVTGKCYVICFSPSHHLTLADMTPAEILPIIETWTNLYAANLDPQSALAKIASSLTIPRLSQTDIEKPNAQYRYMQIFENKGTTMGCSNPHPHGQIWTTTSLPEELSTELQQLSKYRREQNGSHLLVDYAECESKEKDRTVFENDSFWAGVPYWAVWPFEIMIVSRQHRRSLVDLNEKERKELSEAIAEITRRYDNLFETQFPYSTSLIPDPFLEKICFLNVLTHGKHRHGSSPGTVDGHRRRNRIKSLPHPLLPSAAPQRHGAQVPGRLRNARRAAARHHARASRGAVTWLRWHSLPEEVGRCYGCW